MPLLPDRASQGSKVLLQLRQQDGRGMRMSGLRDPAGERRKVLFQLRQENERACCMS